MSGFSQAELSRERKVIKESLGNLKQNQNILLVPVDFENI